MTGKQLSKIIQQLPLMLCILKKLKYNRVIVETLAQSVKNK